MGRLQDKLLDLYNMKLAVPVLMVQWSKTVLLSGRAATRRLRR